MAKFGIALVIILIGLIIGSVHWFGPVWNNPYRHSRVENTGYLPFDNPPKTLDPARSYSSDEAVFIAQIYEPPLQYHYLKRPFTLIPLSAAELPQESYFSSKNELLQANTERKNIAYTVYDIYIKKGMYYQPHPALAKDAAGHYRYHHLRLAQIKRIHQLSQFKYQGSREVTADDFVYEIKRLADPTVQSPIFGLMSQHIVGLAALAQQLKNSHGPFINLNRYHLAGIKIIDRYHYQIKIIGIYPQFKYWLAMTFFAPMPWEACAFYSQKGMDERNVTLDWYPIGSGPYLLSENNPNRIMILYRNPKFHGETYPCEGSADDKAKGYLQDCGKKLPMVDRLVFTLDRESIPRWNKFLQGYYDRSGVSADSFDQAIHIDKNGHADLTQELLRKKIRLNTEVAPSIYYYGFNMLDEVVGGYSAAQQKLRRAISIALDEEQFIDIFLNGRGIMAQGPIPPGVFGYQSGEAGINPWVYEWKNGRVVQKPLEQAKKLLTEAGYPNGFDRKTGHPLVLNYDAAASGGPDDNALFNWMRKQFAQLGIQLNIRATLYNRFQDKVRTGASQFFFWAWSADYPDPENFLFLLYGPNGIVKYGGENTANYNNAQVNSLYEDISFLPDNKLRQEKIDALVNIAREQAPWIFGFYPMNFILTQSWVRVLKPNAIANNTLKYWRIDAEKRAYLRKAWNHPITWPFWIFFTTIVLLFIPLTMTYYRRERRPSIRRL